MKKLKSLDDLIEEKAIADPEFKQTFTAGYDAFKAHVIGDMLREARKAAGYTQEALAEKLNTKKTTVSRLEKHSEDITLSTLFMVANALGKQLDITIR